MVVDHEGGAKERCIIIIIKKLGQNLATMLASKNMIENEHF